MPRIALVVAQFYEELAAEMEDQASEYAAERDVSVVETVHVPGVFDTSLAADRLARRSDVDAVVVLGAVITGDTDHDQVVAHTTAHRLGEVSPSRDTPVTFGIVGPGMSGAEAHERVEKAARAVDAAVDTLERVPPAL
jgi:6,7-dimethyl-8-ribityllumazine synthase